MGLFRKKIAHASDILVWSPLPKTLQTTKVFPSYLHFLRPAMSPVTTNRLAVTHQPHPAVRIPKSLGINLRGTSPSQLPANADRCRVRFVSVAYWLLILRALAAFCGARRLFLHSFVIIWKVSGCICIRNGENCSSSPLQSLSG